MIESRVMPAQPIVRDGDSAPSLARVRYEVFPVACAEGGIVALARQHPTDTVLVPGGGLVPGWWQELPPGRHPTQVVVDALTRELGGAFDPSTSVVHSTSWRYEGEYLVLSYLAALHSVAGAPPGFLLQPVGTIPDRVSRTSDPRAIPVTDVLGHGLRHLAMLRISDPTVASTLSRCWHELLSGWSPLPAGLVEHCVPVLCREVP